MSHNTSSAFSASANPNEDWTKISDLAERRRIQNRIAQRNYRKKLKRRLEDLERKASSSESPELVHSQLAVPVPSRKSASDTRTRSHSSPRKPSQASYRSVGAPSPDFFRLDDSLFGLDLGDAACIATPTIYPFSDCMPVIDYFPQSYDMQQTPQMYSEPPYKSETMPIRAPTLPPMMQSDFLQQQQMVHGNYLDPFSMHYTDLSETDWWTTSEQADMIRTPALSMSSVSDESNANSPPNLSVSLSPLSRPSSPNIQIFDQIWV